MKIARLLGKTFRIRMQIEKVRITQTIAKSRLKLWRILNSLKAKSPKKKPTSKTKEKCNDKI
jgi:hypothetical protein